MPQPAKLKVFRTSIGFHDAYVAAPSQKAAMEAWGSAKDLFARGEAELVTDPALTAEPLARPGVVMKRLRATTAEQLAALPPDKPHGAAKAGGGEHAEPSAKAQARPTPPRKSVPRPSRLALEQAEQEVEAAGDRYRAEREELAEREAALARERRSLEQAQASETQRLEQARRRAAAAYDAAMRKWRG